MDALILAGGKSSRMGGIHKGNLRIGAESFTQRLVNELKAHCQQLFLSYGSSVQQEYEDCCIIRDEYADCGPMGGLHAGLKACNSDILLVAACDMPLLRWDLYSFLLTQLEEYDAVIPVADGKIQPLAAVYTKALLPVLEANLKLGNYRLMSALEQINIHYVELPQFAAMLRNINTVEEYTALLDEQERRST